MTVADTRTTSEAAGVLNVAWHISTRSGNTGGNCVEAGPVLDGSGRVAVRHSRHPDDAVILFSRGAWEAFVAGIKRQEFDLGECG